MLETAVTIFESFAVGIGAILVGVAAIMQSKRPKQ